MSTMCFYVPGESTIQDGSILRAGEWIGQYSGETLATMQARVPGVTLCDFDTAIDQAKTARETKLCGQPVEITKEQYWEWLEVLPPCKWTQYRGAECFFVSETLDADIHQWCVALQGRYWVLNRSAYRSPAAVIEEVAKAVGL